MNGKHRHYIYVSMPLCRVQRGHLDQRDQTDLVEMLYVIVLSRGTASQVCVVGCRGFLVTEEAGVLKDKKENWYARECVCVH